MEKKQQGFTLVELIVVIAILAILAGIAVPAYHGYISKTNDTVSVHNAAAAYRAYLPQNVTAEEPYDLFVYLDAPDRVLAIRDGGVLPEIYGDVQTAAAALTGDPEGEYGILATAVEKLYAVAEGASDWRGASVVFVGDSITYGTGTTKAYHAYLRETGDFSSVTAMGVAGSCISAKSDYGSGNQPLVSRYTSIPDADLIVVFMGTNDYGHETPMGNITDSTDVSFYGALNVVISGIQAQHPDSQLVFMTPLHRYGFGTSRLTGEQFTYDHLPNGRGYTLGDYVNAIKAVCARYSVPVIDLYSQCPIDPANSADKAAYFPDGLHPNAAGHEILADLIRRNLQLVPGKTPTAPGSGGGEEPEPEPSGIAMGIGNKFAPGYVSDTTRASSVKNIYLKKGQTVTFRDTATYQWAMARTADENSSNNAGYSPDSSWSSKSSFTVTADGWYGLTVLRNDKAAFDLGGADPADLMDYLIIE